MGKPFGSRFGQLVSKIPYCDIPFESNPVALPVLYFYWSLYPVTAIVLSGRFIVSILLPIVSFSNHRLRLERYRLSPFRDWRLPFVQIPPIDRESLELVSKMRCDEMKWSMNFRWNIPSGKTGIPYQTFLFRYSRKFSTRTTRKVVFHLLSNRNFGKHFVNGEQPLTRFDKKKRRK